MKTPAHRRKKEPFKRAQLAPRIAVKDRCAQCRKVSYPTEEAALRAAAHLALSKTSKAPVGRAYECPRGNGFHVTSMRKAA